MNPRFPFAPSLPLLALPRCSSSCARFLESRCEPAWFQFPAVALRLAAIVLVALLLMNPSNNIATKTPDSHSLVLLDESASMSPGTRWADSLK